MTTMSRNPGFWRPWLQSSQTLQRRPSRCMLTLDAGKFLLRSSVRLISSSRTAQLPQLPLCNTPSSFRSLHSSAPRLIPALSNHSASHSPSQPSTASPLTIEAYHEYADEYLETVLIKLEDMGETKLDMDVEFSAGVLNCIFPPHGTYVLNKQPPNRQIWLSSPVSGPKRYDYVLQPGMDERLGEWVYLRDGSTLTDLLREELGVVMED